MRSVAFWSVRLVISAFVLGSSFLVQAQEDSGVDKGNGTLPVRMEGHIASVTNKIISFESLIASVRPVDSSKFVSRCELRGPTVKSFTADGSFYLSHNYNAPYAILEICRDSKGPGIEIVAAGPGGDGVFRFYGSTKEVLDTVISMEGTLAPGGYYFYLEAADASQADQPNH